MAERYDFYVHDNRKITFNLTEPIMREDNHVTDWVIHIPKTLNELEVSEWSWCLVYVNAKGEKRREPLELSDDPESPLEKNIGTYSVDYGMSIKAGTVLFAIEGKNADTSGTVLNEWHTYTYEHKVKETIQGDDAEYDDSQKDVMAALIVQVQTKMNQVIGGATPTPVASVSAMTDPSKLYLLTTDGEWYYYNGSAWVSGGVYGVGVTDAVPTQGSTNAVSSKSVWNVQKNLEDVNTRLNTADGKIKTVPYGYGGMADEVTVEYAEGLIKLNGTSDRHNIVLEADSDAVTMQTVFEQEGYRYGITSGLIDANTNARKPHCNAGKYRLVFNMLSGTVTKNGVTYTSNADFGSKNVVNAFILKPDAVTSNYSLLKTNVTKEFDLPDTDIGIMALYCYKDCTFDNAVFELYLEKVEEGQIPYWKDEINRGVSQIQSNIISATGTGSTTVCFVTDCHWKTNAKHSPTIIKELFEKCNINYFVNGGDLLYSHTETKQEAIDELTDCINAFRNCGKPMITLYGNHDRNRNGGNTAYPERLLSHNEHANIVFKSFLPNPHIVRVTSDFAGFYWEDEAYRYACLYWFSSTSHAFPEAQEICNTTKPVIIFCHGIYYSLGATTASDVMDNEWILNAFEPYKAKIKCFVQGHTHVDGIRHAWGTVPIIVIDCDTVNTYSTVGTITEQSIAVITFDTDKISVVKVGRGEDFVVTADSADWRQEYSGITPNPNIPL